MAIFQVMKCDVKCGMRLNKFDCRETTLSNAANHFEIFLIEFEVCLYKHLYVLYIRNSLFPIAVFISMLLHLAKGCLSYLAGETLIQNTISYISEKNDIFYGNRLQI